MPCQVNLRDRLSMYQNLLLVLSYWNLLAMKAVRADISILAFAALPYFASATCYDIFGSPQSSFYPCNSSAEVSTCCSYVDYCLSNGLCLDDGANNAMTQQGCTDPNWDSPCHTFCTSNNRKWSRQRYAFVEAFKL